MSMNKKMVFVFSIIVLLFSATLMVDAATTTLKHEYVGVNFCDEDAVKKVLALVGYVVVLAKIAVPLVLIGLGTFDLYQGVVGKSDKELTSGIKSLVFRLIAGVIIFFIPSIVNTAFDLIYESSGDTTNSCVTCVLDPFDC